VQLEIAALQNNLDKIMYPFLFEKLKNSFSSGILMGGSVPGSKDDV
jgi:hypothetical protein